MIKVFTEVGRLVGFGHLTRMRSLKDQLNADGYKTCMIVQAEDDDVAQGVQLSGDERIKQWINDIDVMRSEARCCDVAVIDTYKTTAQFMKRVTGICPSVVAVDDNNRIPYENCIVLNPNFYGSYLEYPMGVGAEYYLGSRYTLLRPEFHVLGERVLRDSVHRILITFGGTDVLNLTPKIIEYCHAIAPCAGLDVVVTSGFSNIETIKQALKRGDHLHINVNATQMNILMNQVDFAIASAGSTSNELIKTRCPSILIQVAENQSDTIKYLEPQGYFKVFKMDSFEEIDQMLDVEVRRGIYSKLNELDTESTAKTLIEHIYDRL